MKTRYLGEIKKYVEDGKERQKCEECEELYFYWDPDIICPKCRSEKDKHHQEMGQGKIEGIISA